MVLLNPKSEQENELPNNAISEARAFLEKHTDKLIKLQALKDDVGVKAFEEQEEFNGVREFLEAAKLILKLIDIIAVIQSNRIAELMGMLEELDEEEAGD